MKTLFLDIDGVLHANLAPEAALFNRAPALAAALEGFAPTIVISSSWRFHHPFAHIVRRLPPRLRERIAGATGAAVTGRHARWQEIQAYCRQHAELDWLALDDAGFEFPPDCPQLCLCDGATGIGPRELADVRRWLGRPGPCAPGTDATKSRGGA